MGKSGNKTPSIVNLDPRTKLLLVFLTGSFSVMLSGYYVGLIIFSMVFIMAILCGLWKKACLYAVIFVLLQTFYYSQNLLASATIGFMGYIIKFIPLALAVSAMYQTTEVSMIIEALRRMKLPMQIVIPFAVFFRFFPSIRQDIVYITQSMRTRGIALTGLRVFLHPLQTYEFLVVPILMRLLTAAEELSASAETRGLSYPCTKTKYFEVELVAVDYICMLLLVIGFILLTFYSNY